MVGAWAARLAGKRRQAFPGAWAARPPETLLPRTARRWQPLSALPALSGQWESPARARLYCSQSRNRVNHIATRARAGAELALRVPERAAKQAKTDRVDYPASAGSG